MTDTDPADLPDDVKDTIVEVNDLLEHALAEANTYSSHEKVRASAIRAFDTVQQAHVKLSAIDPSRDGTRVDPEVRHDVE